MISYLQEANHDCLRLYHHYYYNNKETQLMSAQRIFIS